MRDIIYVENSNFVTATDTSIKIRSVITKENKYFPFESVSCLIFDHPKSYFSAGLVTACLNRDILLIFCDEKHTPITSLHPEYGYVKKYKKLSLQIKQGQRSKNRMWQKVVKQKFTTNIYV